MSGPVRILLTIVGALVIGAAAVFLVVQPARLRIGQDQQVTRDLQAQLDKFWRVTRRITDLEGEIRRLEEALAFFESRLPQEREIDVVLREVWLIADGQELLCQSVRTHKLEVMPRYNSQPIKLSLEGRFDGFYQFLLGLEQLPRITKIRELEVTQSPTEEETVHAEILLDIFFEK